MTKMQFKQLCYLNKGTFLPSLLMETVHMFGHDLVHRTQLTPNFFFLMRPRINTPTTLPTQTSDPLNFSCALERVENEQNEQKETEETHGALQMWFLEVIRMACDQSGSNCFRVSKF